MTIPTFNNFFKIVAVTLGVIITFWAIPAQSQSTGQEIVDAALAFIAAEQEAAAIPGVITAVVVDGDVVFASGYGMADIEAQRSANENTRFRVGSVSKPVTATGALSSMARHGLHPESDLRTYFTDLPFRPALEGPLTFHQLLTHTGGFNESLSRQHVTNTDDFIGLTEYLQSRLPPRFIEPGRVITYNDHHTTLAGFAVERLDGMPFHQSMHRHVFEPLGMHSSSYDQIDLVTNDENPLARSYSFRNGVYAPYDEDLILTTPSAGLVTTSADMGRYMAWLLAHDAEHPQLNVQFRSMDRLRGRAYGFAETSRGGHLVLYKDGQANGFGARIIIVPELGLGIFVAVNRSILGPMGRSNEAAHFLRNYTGAILDAALPSADDRVMTLPTPMANSDSGRFAGTYRTTVAARHTWEILLAAMDTAVVEALPNGNIAIGSGAYVPIEEGLFQWHEGGPYYLGFDIADNGSPRHLFIGSGSYERVSWYEGQDGAGKIIFGVGASAILMLLGGAVVGRIHRLSGWGKLAVGGSILRLAFIVGLAATIALMDPQNLFYEMPLGLSLAVGIALAAILLDAFAGVAFLGAKSRTGLGTGVAVIYLSSTGIFVWWLDTWNLLGWQVG